MRTIVLRDEGLRGRAMAAIQGLDLGLKRPWSVVIKPYSTPRNEEQNALMWALATKLGSHLGYSKNEMIDILKFKLLPTKDVELPDGTRHTLLASTSGMSKREMSDFIDQIYQWGASLGCDFDE